MGCAVRKIIISPQLVQARFWQKKLYINKEQVINDWYKYEIKEAVYHLYKIVYEEGIIYISISEYLFIIKI